MDYIKKFVLPLVISAVIAVILLVFRSVPVSQLWKGYSVLYVPVKTNPEVVFETLNEKGCKDVISFYNQQIPFVNPLLPLKADESDSYISGRNSYFFDKDRNVMIYYIPKQYSNNAEKAAAALIKDHAIDAGLDCKSSFPLLTPVICIIAALLFFIFSTNHLVFLIAALFPLLFTFTMPFYVNAAAVCILLYSIYLCQKLWNRKGSFNYILTSPFIIMLVSLSLIAAFFASVLSGLFFILCCTASCMLLLVLHNIQVYFDSKRRFCPVLIRPAKFMKMINTDSVKKVFISVASVFVLSFLYITSVSVFSISNSQDLSFPTPTSYNVQTGIPVLNDYIVWTWNSVTKPYRSLNEAAHKIPQKDETVTIQRYVNTNEGIKAKEEILYCFDETFKKEVIESIDELNYPALEKLMKAQNENFSVSYTTGSGEKFSRFSLMMMLSMILLPCLMAIFYLTGRRKYGNTF